MFQFPGTQQAEAVAAAATTKRRELDLDEPTIEEDDEFRLLDKKLNRSTSGEEGRPIAGVR